MSFIQSMHPACIEALLLIVSIVEFHKLIVVSVHLIIKGHLNTCLKILSLNKCPLKPRNNLSLYLNSRGITLGKKSIIIPVPKKACPQENNDYRPVAITSNVFKSFEKLMIEKLHTNVEKTLDKYQFAYKENRGSSDAISTIMHLTLKHLESPAAYARLLFVDFSSAFNSIQPDIILRKLVQLNVNPFLIRWYHSFLSTLLCLI